MKLRTAAAAVLALATLSTTAFAQNSPWLVRGRIVALDSANKDSTGLGLSVNNKTIPEVDISYFYTPNFAVELILSVPQKHTLYSNGASIGTLKHLPPTVLAQYHFTQFGSFKPYVGLGVNFTRFSGVNLTVPGADIDRNSFGGALQLGVDIPLQGNWSLNFDVKKVYIGTDVSVNGAKAGTFKVDPLLFGVGVGYRF